MALSSVRSIGAAKGLLLGLIAVAVSATGAPAAAPHQVADIAPGTSSASPAGLSAVGKRLLFFASTGKQGLELWRTTGTEGSTQLVKDIFPGKPSGITQIASSAVAGGRLFFIGDDGKHGQEPWVSDGTAAGTRMLKDIRPGGGDGMASWFIRLGSRVIFRADDGSRGDEWWVSDGTRTGTRILKDINKGPGGAGHCCAYQIVGKRLYFGADDGTTGNELWRTNGTPASTAFVKNLDASPVGSDPFAGNPPFSDGSHPTQFGASIGDTVFFNAGTPQDGRQVWRSDGTGPATQIVDVPVAGSNSNPGSFTVVDGELYYSAFVFPGFGRELYASNRTQAGTRRLTDINPGIGNSDPTPMGEIDGDLVFAIRQDDSNDVGQVWRTDGSVVGTTFVRDVQPGNGLARLEADRGWTLGGIIHFLADDGTHGVELWRTDGTFAGTRMVKDIRPGSVRSIVTCCSRVLGRLVFSADDGTTGVEPWVSDGTKKGTRRLGDLVVGPGSSSPAGFVAFGGAVYFAATGPDGRELWAWRP